MRNAAPIRRSNPRARAFPIVSLIPNISPTRGLVFLIAILGVAYVGLIAFTMTYAVMHTEYAEQSRDASARVGTLETQYFNALAQVDHTDPSALGYVQPASPHFAVIPSAPTVAIAQ